MAVPVALAMLVAIPRRDDPLNLGCEKCCYSLRGNTSGRCPECGTAILHPVPATLIVSEATPRTSQGVLSAILRAIALFAAITMTYVVVMNSRLQRNWTHFDRSAWNSGHISDRGDMANDLVVSGQLLGLGTDYALQLLGIPDDDALSYAVGLATLTIRWERGVFAEARLTGDARNRQTSQPHDLVEWPRCSPEERLGIARRLVFQSQLLADKSRSDIVRYLGFPDSFEQIEYGLGEKNRRLIVRLEVDHVVHAYVHSE